MAYRLCTIDFETSSQADLLSVGAYKYAEDPTTEILCLCVDLAGEKFDWEPPFTDRAALSLLVNNPEVIFVAHNVSFEKAIWRSIMVSTFGFPDILNERWIDTLASCAYKGIPLGLERAAKVLELDVQKDTDGRAITLAASKIGKDGFYTLVDKQRIIDYCHKDVATETALHKRVGNLSKQERKIWLLDQQINERGIGIDLNFVGAAKAIVEEAKKPLLEEFAGLTNGLKPTQRAKCLEFFQAHGVAITNMKGETLDDFLDKGLITDADAKRAMRIKRLVGGTAVAKLDTMQSMVCYDGRARGLLQYHGAGTGRWAGRLLQPQNFPRGQDGLDADTRISAILSNDLSTLHCFGEPIEIVTAGLRHALVSGNGQLFMAGDFSGIEARLVLALAGQMDLVKEMADGEDIYCRMAEAIYNVPRGTFNKNTHPEERQDGKNTILGCGFRMGAAKFRERYCPHQPMEFAEKAIKAYREERAPLVVKLWYGLEHAARETVWTGRPHEAYGVSYSMEGEWLVGRRPSGYVQHYFHPTPARQEMAWSTEEDPDVRAAWYYWAWKYGQWRKVYMHGGVLTENVIQGLARDLMVHSMFNLETAGLPIVLTVHDEIVVEAPEKLCDIKMLGQIMADAPPWAKEMKAPISVECWKKPEERYRK